MLNSIIGRLRLVGMLEAVTYILLLGFAMPMKYIWHQEVFVHYIGWAHGLLFILYCLALLHAKLALKLSITFSLALFIAALVPLGPFFADRKLREHKSS